MATAAPSPPRHDVGRSGSAEGSPERYYVEEEFKENVGRKPLANIAMPPSGVIHGTPRSPVRIEVPREDWHQSQSASIVEGSEYSRQVSGETRTSEQNENPGSQASNKQEFPFRPKHQGESTDMPKEQEAFKPSKSDGNSRLPLDEHRTNRGNVRHSLEGVEENEDSFVNEPVPQLQYHHHSHNSEGAIRPRGGQSYLPNDPSEAGPSIDRFLTPKSPFARRTPIQRPHSTYSDFGARERSPAQPGYVPNSPSWGARAPSANSGRSNDRPLSYVDLLNVPYPQPPPVPISFGNSQLRLVVGTNASLLSTQKTLDMYRQNVKKTSDSETQYAFAIFLIQAAQEAGLNHEGSVSTHKASPKSGRDLNSPYIDSAPSSPQELLREARNILQKLSDRSYPFAQYYLADGYASGLFNKGKEDYGTAFPLFVSASKHGHAESGYRAALCYEFGWGCRKDPAKAVQFYRQAASKNHPGAMTRLGRACLSGDLGTKQYREGLKWLKRATESADQQYNAAPYHLGQLYETGYGDDLFQDETYAAQLFTQAADLGHAEANYRLGDAYEHGKLSCPRDPALSVHFYTGAAQRGHPVAMMALCAWYMVGAEPVLEKDENEAYEWARQAAECGLTKAEYAVGYFTEMGIGCRRDILEANVWYVKAADSGDERAKHRLEAIKVAAAGGTPMDVVEPKSAKMKKAGKKAVEPGNRDKENEKDCIIM